MTTSDDAYPEHDKLRAVAPYSQKVGEFLDWLSEQGVALCRRHDHTEDCEPDEYAGGAYRERYTCGYLEGEWVPDAEGTIDRLARFFEIDLQKIEDERRAMLDAIRAERPSSANPGR